MTTEMTDDQVFELLKNNGKIAGVDADACHARFAQGRDAAKAGKSRKDNPYDFMTDCGRNRQWNDGFTYACDNYWWPESIDELHRWYDEEYAA